MLSTQTTFLYHPDGRADTLRELETVLNFKYLSHIAFETSSEEEDVRKRGMEKWASDGVSAESQELGKRFIKEIETAYIPAVSIRWISKAVGYGLFAEEDLDAGSYVGEYTGIVRKNNRRYFAPINNYCYEYPVPDSIGRSFVIDATAGNLTRFINHSFTPNLKPIHVFFEGFYHLIFLALHHIAKGSQLSYDYGQSYWYVREPPESL